MCQKLLLYMGELKAQKEKHKIPEEFGRKVGKNNLYISQKKKTSGK